MSKFISVVIPVYNTEKYLKRCIDSVVAQSFTDWELILVDDGSYDNSGKICDDYAARDKRIMVKHQKNGGVSKARNIGLGSATGEYVTFLDSDDWLDSNAFAIYHDIVSTPPQSVDIIKCGYHKDYDDGHQEDITICDKITIDSPTEMFVKTEETQYYGFLWNEVIKRSVIGAIRFDEDLCWCEDHLFSLQVFSHCRSMVMLPNKLYHYCITPDNSLSDVRNPQLIIDVANKEWDYKVNSLCTSSKAVETTKNTYYGRISYAIDVLFKNKNYAERRKFHLANLKGLRTHVPNKSVSLFFSDKKYFIIEALIRFHRILSKIKRHILIPNS